MPRDRLERTVVLNEVRELDRQQRMREGMMNKINANPALKKAYETLVKDLPRKIAQKPHRTPRGRPRARPATKAGRCRGLKPATPPALVTASHGSLSSRQASVRFFQ
jgi:hypothetical protein